MRMIYRTDRTGFSLTELSLALVIMGVIASAIMGGVKFLDYAKTRAFISGIETHQSAIYGFVGKYEQFPGDFEEAGVYWPSANPQNGNADGKISFSNEDAIQEGYNAWQHLSLAHMENHDFAGAASGPVAVAEINVHVPETVYGGAFFLAYAFADLDELNTIVAGAPISVSGTQLQVGGLLLQKQAREADVKTDDGNPSVGNVRATAGTGATVPCIDDNETPQNKEDDLYDLKTTKAKSCVMAFRIVSQ